jgi:hypothetical protein
MNANNETAYRPAKNAADAIAHVKAGGVAFVATVLRTTQINKKTLEKFERAGYTLLKDHSDGGIVMMNGRRSVYLLPGQLKLA